jgi:acyl-CoA synthetase (AMP-forming)/AMP-acid ligase II
VADERRVSWRDRYPDEITCVRCLEPHDQTELDRMLWCSACRARARARAAWLGWLGGLLFGAGVAIYVWTAIRPTDLVIGGWIATVVAAVWIGSKVARELVYGIMRFRNVHAAEASPPDAARDPPTE